MNRFSIFALVSLFSATGCLHFEDTFLAEGNDASNIDGSSGDVVDAGTPDADLSALEISIQSTDFRLQVGETLNIVVGVERLNGLTGAVDVTASGLPTGVTVGALQIADGQQTGTLTFTASATPDFGTAEVEVAASLGSLSAPGANLPLFVADVPGNFDTTFNGGAGITIPTVSEIKDLLITPSGRILVLANESGWKVFAYDAAGQLESDFGTNGRAIVPTGLDPVAMTLRSNGGLFLGVNNTSPVQAGVVAFTSTGGLDVSYNSGQTFISTIDLAGQTTSVTDIVVDAADGVYMSGQFGGGNIGAIYSFPSNGQFSGAMASSDLTPRFTEIRLSNNQLFVGGAKGGQPVFLLQRYGTNLTLDTTFGAAGTFESGRFTNALMHFDVDGAGRIAAASVNSNPDIVVDFLDADASSITSTVSGLNTGSANFGGDGHFNGNDYVLAVNGCSASCSINDSELISLDSAVPADGTYTRDPNIGFGIDDGDMDATWSLDALAFTADGRILIAGENAGTPTLLRVWQ